MVKTAQQVAVIVVGAGPSGLATAACLTKLSIPYIILEREDCFAPLWKKHTYDRLHLHLPKQFCELPHMPLPGHCPTFVPRRQFIDYLEDYVTQFRISPAFRRSVEEAEFDADAGIWSVRARNLAPGGEVEAYSGRFLVVASGETSDAFVPAGEADGFTGDVIHSTKYKNGKELAGKDVLVVGSGNSGMEIAYDLCNYGARASISVRSPVHILTREMVYMGLVLLKYVPYKVVDALLVLLSKLVFGDVTKYGLQRPAEGPFTLKVATGKYPVIDMGTFNVIKSGLIQVLPAIKSVKGNCVVFNNGNSYPFDSIIFATGFRTSSNKWLKGGEELLNENGITKLPFPNHWKGKNGLYCVGLARRGLYGAAADAVNVASDIKSLL